MPRIEQLCSPVSAARPPGCWLPLGPRHSKGSSSTTQGASGLPAKDAGDLWTGWDCSRCGLLGTLGSISCFPYLPIMSPFSICSSGGSCDRQLLTPTGLGPAPFFHPESSGWTVLCLVIQRRDRETEEGMACEGWGCPDVRASGALGRAAREAG